MEIKCRVGIFLDPKPEDKTFENAFEAARHASDRSIAETNAVIGVWGPEDETLLVVINGQEFAPI